MKEEELIAAFEKDLDAAIKENKPLYLDETPSFFRLPLKMQRRIREIASFSERLYRTFAKTNFRYRQCRQ